MKVTAIANLSANGKVLLADTANHQSPKGGEEFFIQKIVEAKNVVLGRKTFEVVKKLLGGEEKLSAVFPGVEIVIISSREDVTRKFKILSDANAALKHLRDSGFDEVIIGGGTEIYNLFLQKKLLTDIYFNFVPVITGGGGIVGNDPDFFQAFNLIESKLLDGGIIQIHLKA